MFRDTFARIDLEHLRHNWKVLKDRLPEDAFCCAMVKANAYGHGDIAVTRALVQIGVRHFGVASVDEALPLRREFGNPKTRLLVFGRWNDEAARAAWELDLTPVVSRKEDLFTLSQAAVRRSAPLPIHIKIDTGMHRMGFDPDEVATLRTVLEARKDRLRLTGVCTHLSHGEDAGTSDGVSARQVRRFEELIRPLDRPGLIRHVYNSAGLLTRPPEMVGSPILGARPGLALYGLSKESDRLKPVMSLHTRIDQIHHIPQGECVSYGGRWRAARPSWIGVVPVGYGDGYWRWFGNQASMLFRGRRVPVVGSVCMDYSLLDLTDAVSAEREAVGEKLIGEDIVVFGSQQQECVSVAELAGIAQTIPYELVTGLSRRVPRVYE